MRRLGTGVASLLVIAIFIHAAGAAETDEAQQRRMLSGEWQGFAVEGTGENPDTGPVKIELEINDKSIHGVAYQGERKMDQGEGEYTLDLSSKPLQLDGAKLRGGGRKQVWLGIYTLEGDTLKWCVGRRQRPTKFETVKGQFLLILRRQ